MERYVRRDVQAREDAAAQAVAMGSRIIHHYDRHPPPVPCVQAQSGCDAPRAWAQVAQSQGAALTGVVSWNLWNITGVGKPGGAPKHNGGGKAWRSP